MSQRKKEEERIERIIRGLLKLPENRRCINCNSLGPQYVCTTFWTFVCTNCSGIHREFTHRVKSVSMAKFNTEEVSALQAGGNERARQIYFKAWDPQRNSFPDGSNLHRLRDFIKHVYVDRKYTGEWISDKLPKVKLGVNDDFYERRSFERSSLGSRDDFYERHSYERSSPSGRSEDRNLRNYIDGRSPRYKQENSKNGGHRSRTAHFEIVDDRFRDDGIGSGRRSENRRFSYAEFRAGSMSPDSQKSRETTTPPKVRLVKDLLGESVPHLKVGEPPKANDGKDADGSARAQKTASSSIPGPVDVYSVEPKTENSSSLIDFSTDPELPDTSAMPQTQRMASSIDGGNSSVQSSTVEKANTPNVNSVESLLFELSGAAVVAVSSISEAPRSGDAPSAIPVALSNGIGANVTASTTNTPAVPSNGGASAASPVGNALALPTSGGDYMVAVTDGQQLLTMYQHQPSASPSGDSSSAAQQSTSSVEVLSTEPWTSSPALSAQGPPPNASVEQSSQAAPKLAQDTSSGEGTKSSGRKELPADLFALSYSSYPAPIPSWQFRPSQGMGFSMQYHPSAMPLSAFPNSAKSTNPFDLGDDTTEVQATMFPSMSSLQGALPQVSTHAGLQPQSSPYASALPQQPPSYGVTASPGAYMGQQLPNSMPLSRPQGISSFGGGEAAFASLNPIQQPSGRYPAPTAPNSFSSMGGNPFG